MRSPKISVIMPCYNAERTVLRALDSLRLQTLKDLEVIAVNDGSTDGTRKILEQYRDSYPQFALKVFSKEITG
jgi:glycosyltransferase involved in cell wall biosynthesis